MKSYFSVLLSLLLNAVFLFHSAAAADGHHSMKRESFGAVQGNNVDLYTLRNAHGLEVRVTNYGGIIVSLLTPDKNGRFEDVVLGFDGLQGYLDQSPYFGAIVGRYGNRIAKGTFKLDGKQYSLAINNAPNSLHGGKRGFDKVIWKAVPFENPTGVGLIFTYLSKDGEEGFPGNLHAKVTYTLTDSDELIFDYGATSDQATPVNLTQHSYFNLAGAGRGDILAHEVMLNADRFTPVDDTLIPTGELRAVRNTPMDFTRTATIGSRIKEGDEQLIRGRGYDHNFVLRRSGSGSELAARVRDPGTGRVLEVYTTEPGIQFYSGNFLDGTITGKGGQVYKQHFGLLPGDAAFSRLAQPFRISFDDSQAGAGVQVADDP